EHGAQRLEGLCEAPSDVSPGAARRIAIGHGTTGIERLEACFVGPAFSPHRHDTYAIGVTLSGVQSFRYRGVQRYGRPGQYHVLHPDEIHDGGPGTETGFSYRIVYVDPALVQSALGGRTLPFVADPIIGSGVLDGALPSALWRLDEPIENIARVEITA